MALQNNNIAGIILAAGKGTRINSRSVNKVVYPFNSKPMITYGVELLDEITSRIVVVVGAFSASVKQALGDRKKITFAEQKHRLGTGHAVRIALKALAKDPPDLVLVGMGDHMMFYKQNTIKKLVASHQKESAAVSFITTTVNNPSGLGRVERDENGKVLDVVEEKDASPKQRKIKEINAGFYCFYYNFLASAINLIKRSPVTGEYYLPDLIKVACLLDLPVVAMPVAFKEVGIGVNKHEELEQSQKFFKKLRTS